MGKRSVGVEKSLCETVQRFQRCREDFMKIHTRIFFLGGGEHGGFVGTRSVGVDCGG